MGCGSSKPAIATANSVPRPEPKTKAHQNDQPDEFVEEESLELTFEEAAALRVSDPSSMWAIVKKTCNRIGPNREWKVEPVKNRRGWKTIRLFVSSTFRDFHNEREVLVKEVRIIYFGCMFIFCLGCVTKRSVIINSHDCNIFTHVLLVYNLLSLTYKCKRVTISWVLTRFFFHVT